MARFKKLPVKKDEGKVVYGTGIVNDIVALAMKEVTFAELYSFKPSTQKADASDIKVYFEKDGVYIDVKVKVHFNQCVSDVAFKIQETVRHNVEAMTEYHVAGVNVIVSAVSFNEEPIVDNTNENQKDSKEEAK